MKLEEPIRLIGIRLDNLVDRKISQVSLFDKNNSNNQEKLDKTIDKLKEKYGNKIIKRASMITKEEYNKIK